MSNEDWKTEETDEKKKLMNFLMNMEYFFEMM